MKPANLFGVVKRDGDTAIEIRKALTEREANEIADQYQADNPNERYAVVQLVFIRHTKPEGK